MNNLSSYCGLVDAKIRPPDKDLPVQKSQKMTNSPESIEAVNGKIDMGTRKLKAAYVENATTLYAYLEADFHVLKGKI